ncbi:HipA family kinase [Clostridium botulinum]|uniref:HipA family kinase n=1 Tax=Clostridium botulinum TaxID=1491 RepID=UPI00388EDC54
MKEIEIETFLKPMGEGVTRPALVIGNDYNEYILKNEDVDEDGKLVKYNCMFVNELLAFQIGKFLDVPMPEAVIALIDSTLIEGDPTIRFAYRFKAGKYFGTEKLKQIENNYIDNYRELANMNKPYISKSWNKFFKNIENKKDIPKILAFDLLIANFDRYINTGNILVNREKKDMRNIYAIDHGHAFFGPIWNEYKIDCLGIKQITEEYVAWYCTIILNEIRRSGPFGSGTIFGVLENYVNLEDVQNHSFSDIIIKMRSINENIIREWCNNIPSDWYIDKEMQVIYYTNFLMKQKDTVEQIIQMLANNNAFTNYRGGILRYETCEERNLI